MFHLLAATQQPPPQPPTPWFAPLLWYAAYALPAALALLAWRRERRLQPVGRAGPFVPGYWLALAAILALLGAARSLHLHTLITSAGRQASRSEGWYVDRRPVQAATIAFIALLGLAAATLAARRMRGHWRPYLLPTAVLIYLATLVLIRMISLHQADAFFAIDLAGLRLGACLEITGSALLALTALRQAAASRSAPPLDLTPPPHPTAPAHTSPPPARS